MSEPDLSQKTCWLDLALASRLEAFAEWAERYTGNIRHSEIADIRLAVTRIRELTDGVNHARTLHTGTSLDTDKILSRMG